MAARHLAQPIVNLVTACIFGGDATTTSILGVTLRDKGNPCNFDRYAEALRRAAQRLTRAT